MRRGAGPWGRGGALTLPRGSKPASQADSGSVRSHRRSPVRVPSQPALPLQERPRLPVDRAPVRRHRQLWGWD